MNLKNGAFAVFLLFTFFCISPVLGQNPDVMEDKPVVKLRAIDKITARTTTFQANVGSTVKFGSLYIKVQSCRKAPPIEQPESASFLQVWEVKEEPGQAEGQQGKAEWVFSGWMFASSPALSYMDHPIYDVWVLDCLESKEQDETVVEGKDDQARADEGQIAEDQVPAQPDMDIESKTLPAN